ncbi:hypothetical protein BROUX41_001569 [Berkeleyomyces rouxiae]|uniref:uncharacterized protein n=1 Tax=Berkeleyomyces rouxiae TaxID=2035830 RepID=UPI003B7AF49C
MHFLQPAVPALPAGLVLTGKTIIVTGATSGIGLEICRQLLARKVSTLIMAVRNTAKGETVRQSLLSEAGARVANPNATVRVMQLDTEQYDSVQRFANAFRAEFQDLHALIANAGIGTPNKELASSGHEKNIQVNYLSNVLLTLALLPTLEATGARSGEPTRVSWTCSRMIEHSSMAKKATALQPGEGVLAHFANINGVATLSRYADSKLLGALFQRELANHYSTKDVIINSYCPGHVDTPMGNDLPLVVRMISNLVKAIRARTVDQGGWIALNAALLAGPETHGKMLSDTVLEEPWSFITSPEGRNVQRKLWNETIDEMAAWMTLPAWMTKLA